MNSAYYFYDLLIKFRSLTIKTTQVNFIKQVNPVSYTDFLKSSVTYYIATHFLSFFISRVLYSVNTRSYSPLDCYFIKLFNIILQILSVYCNHCRISFICSKRKSLEISL